MSVRATLVLLGLALSACGPTIFSIQSYRGHRALDNEGLQELLELAQAGTAVKADVLTRLGPPVTMIGQPDGEIFVYRRVAVDTNTFDLNPGYVVPSIPAVSLYANRDVSGRDDVLMVFFDVEGRLRGASVREGIQDTSRSRAAALGEGMREWVE